MAITYVNDLRLSEMATGDNSGTWGTVTNTNLELIGDALGYGTRAIADASSDNITIADGTADADRAMYLKLSGGGQACEVTLLPTTVSKVWIMENGTNSALTFKQGSSSAGDKVIIPAGDTKIIATDGGGGSGVVYDVLTSLSVVDLKVQDDLTVTDDATIGGTLGVTGIATFTDDIIIGDGKTIGSASDVDAMTIAANGQVTFTQTLIGTALDISGDIDVDGTANLDNVDVDGSFAIQQANSNTPTLLVQAATTASDFSISGYSDSSGAYYMLGANNYLNSSGNQATWDANENTASIFLDSRGTNGIEFSTGTGTGTLALVIRNGGDIIIQNSGGTLQTATAGDSNFRAGVNAGTSILDGGNYNVVVGDEAGTALTTGDTNTAIGYSALAGEDAHGDNVAIGSNSLKVLNAGTNAANVAVGGNTGASLTDGVRNVIIGYNAASAATTPDDCVIIGWEAAHNATLTGHDSVMIGKHAGYSMAAGGAAVFIGKAAGTYAESGNYNTFVGYESGYGNNSAKSSGDDNTAVGYRSGYLLQGAAAGNSIFGAHAADALTTGSRITAIGFGALNSETTGTRAVAVGYNALAVQNKAAESHNTSVGYNSSGAVTSGDHNTAMGYGAFDDCDDGNNNVAIGSGSLSANCGSNNTAVGNEALNDTTGDSNTAVGSGAGDLITSGSKNSILGRYDGNQNGLDIRTSDNNIVLSDGDGVPYAYAQKSTGTYANYNWVFGGNNVTSVGSYAETVVIGESANASGYALAITSQAIAVRFVHLSNATSSDGVCGSIELADNSTTYATSSDYRLKENVVYDWDATTRLKQLKPARFNWIADNTNTLVDGFLAHEAQAVVPEAVTGTHNAVDDDGNAVMQGIDQSKLVPLLVKAIQELEARIATLEG
jgi:trimeric autotransporter adhesin